MATNADPVVDDDKEVTEDDLRDLKYGTDGVEPSIEEDEPEETEAGDEESEEAVEEEEKSEDSAEEESEEQSEDEASFVKEFPNIKGETPEEYAKNLEEAYKNSTAEALRLKGIAEAPTTVPENAEPEIGSEEVAAPTSTLELYAQQQLDREIKDAYDKFSKEYSQVTDPVEYSRFTVEVATLSNAIYTSQKRLASPDELYSKAAVILGWEKDSAPTSKDKLKMAAKDNAATGKITSASGKATPKSKVTDEMIRVNKAMYPGKTDAEIRKELEPYVI